MFSYKVLVVLDEGLVFGLLAIGICIAFQWLRFPDLTPDGSFVFGATVFVKAASSGISPIIALCFSFCVGALAGSCTAAINKAVKVPTVVAGLLVSSALYSTNWLVLGKPNQFLNPKYTLVGDISGKAGASHFLLWLIPTCGVVTSALVVFSGSIWGIRARAIGENALLANDIGTSETKYTFLGLALANGIVGLSGALFSQRSFSADIGMGVGITVVGLTGLVLGLLITSGSRRMSLILTGILAASVLYKGITFLTLELGLPAESFRLISALILLGTFISVRASSVEFLKSLKWS